MNSVYRCKHLTGRKLKIFLAVANTIIPRTDAFPGGGTMTTAGIADWSLSHLQKPLRAQILFFLYVIEAVGILFGGRFFSHTSINVRIKELRWLENSSLRVFRLGFFGIKNYVCMGYYTREEVWKRIGYTGPVEPDRSHPDSTIRSLSQGTIEVVE